MEGLNNDSPYSVMFGPDKCFRDTNKVSHRVSTPTDAVAVADADANTPVYCCAACDADGVCTSLPPLSRCHGRKIPPRPYFWTGSARKQSIVGRTTGWGRWSHAFQYLVYLIDEGAGDYSTEIESQ